MTEVVSGLTCLKAPGIFSPKKKKIAVEDSSRLATVNAERQSVGGAVVAV